MIRIKDIMGVLAGGRKSVESGDSYQLREPPMPYIAPFEVKKGDIGPDNTCLWDI